MKSLWRLARSGQLWPSLAANALYKPFYRLIYLAALKESGVMDTLRDGPVGFAAIASVHAPHEHAHEALAAWLQLGERLGLVSRSERGYALAGLAAKLARPENDGALALAQEVAGLHHRLIRETPGKLRRGELWGLDNQDAGLTTRSSRALEAFIVPALERFVPRSDACRVLEVGCGSGIYLRHMANLNPRLTALGLELQGDAATVARNNIDCWGLADRVEIAVGDVRTLPVKPPFDLVTLHNNIYYFAVDERAALLARLRAMLVPGGALLITTCCQGGNAGMEALNLWGASNEHGGRLPFRDEMATQLREAGFDRVDTMRLIPGDALYAFRAA